ncbi:Beta-1,3-galactosyl-O-glycosyl-glycoprotein beta-1,6-N-acetylglucosaminyltransferase [Merluccius polli]|uniref:Beta-1,3-galactosyl-O-glycosyl-glycoprotein beta-1,6-N-acetylglucosaminyltransferase n=1 Tax=Merluccius polli TaxID=89951 RepID=A0AA47P2X6_MERPO|nr:Beta-1,3-galactosyl-O-glycosyl-glycoprotein beta-1,6-N-acetylglucosaminyltransferase [Merluccius polli]
MVWFRWRRRRSTFILVRLGAILATLGTMAFVIIHSEIEWDPTLSYSWPEYIKHGGDPKDACNCSSILQGDANSIEQAQLLSINRNFRRNATRSDDYYINATLDCRTFKSSKKYVMFPLSKEEEDFPLAYSIVVHHMVSSSISEPHPLKCIFIIYFKSKSTVTDVQNFEHLLRAIYAPQNIYCIHVDRKADASFLEAIMSITSCFPNVFMVSRPVEVVYAAWPRVQADINCMADLYNASAEWKYFINLCGQDFPLKTNLEMVRSLKALKGANSMETEQMSRREEGQGDVFLSYRGRTDTEYVCLIDNSCICFVHSPQHAGTSKEPAPFNLPIMMGNAYIVASRGYIRSVLEDQRVQQLIEWGKDTYSPDEFLWATIQRMPNVPGSLRPDRKYDLSDMYAIARMVKWGGHEGAVYPACQGHHVRGICVYGVADLQWLLEQHHLFANKFDMKSDPLAIRCLEWYLRQKALADMQSAFQW